MNEIWVKNSPITLTEGAEPTYTIVFDGATAVTTTNAAMAIYKNGTGSDLTATMTSGSYSASGNALALKKLIGFVGGNDYTLSITATVDGVLTKRKVLFHVQTAGEVQ